MNTVGKMKDKDLLDMKTAKFVAVAVCRYVHGLKIDYRQSGSAVQRALDEVLDYVVMFAGKNFMADNEKR
jgi:hypothetical protein